jgi:putative membrane protein
MLTTEDHVRIDAAIDAVEKKTSGDIYCLVAHEASHYREVPLAWAAIVSLLAPALALTAGLRTDPVIKLFEGWSAAGVSREFAFALLIWTLAQALLFALSALVISIPPVRRIATPGFLKRHRVLSLARQHFVSSGLHLARGQPHVLIFLALAERRVEILADDAVHKVAGDTVWREATTALTDAMRRPDPTAGIIRAVEIAGQPLIDHFPATRAEQPREGLAEL